MVICPVFSWQRGLHLLPRESLIATSDVDHADWNYRAALGWLQTRRFRLVLSLLAEDRYVRLLEIGYGSGVFLPELSGFCDELFGIDPHNRNQEVMDVLRGHNVAASLSSGSVEDMPFDERFFDCAVAVSALEYVENIELACRELSRVLKPGGVLIVITPGQSPWLDLGLRLVTGESAEENYGDRRERLVPTLTRHFKIDREHVFPASLAGALPVYRALRLVAV